MEEMGAMFYGLKQNRFLFSGQAWVASVLNKSLEMSEEFHRPLRSENVSTSVWLTIVSSTPEWQLRLVDSGRTVCPFDMDLSVHRI